MRIFRASSSLSYQEALERSIDQLEMDVNAKWYDALRFSLVDLNEKSDTELKKQQEEFVKKYISPQFI